MDFLARPKCFRKYTFGAWIWTQILYFFDWTQEIHRPLNMSRRGTQNKDSSYVPMEGRKNCSLTISTRFRLGNIFPLSRDQCSRNRILRKKYVSGKLYTSSNHLENTLKSDLRSPFRQELVNSKDFLGVAWVFYKEHIPRLNMNTNFTCFRLKSWELLSFEYVPPRYPK